MLPPGTMLLDRWRVERELGAGAAAVVYLASDLRDGAPVAIKVLRDADDPAAILRLEREVRCWRDVAHPACVQLLDGPLVADVDELRSVTFLVLEYVAGSTLEQTLGEVGGLAADEALELLVPIAGALATVHGAGVVHRDVKPANILLDELGHPRLTDLGIAHLVDATRLTAAGAVLGTPRYAAPEQLTGGVPTPRWDVYALGRVGLDMLDGAHAGHQVHGLLERMAAVDPNDRPKDAAHVFDELARMAPDLAAGNEPTSVRAPATDESTDASSAHDRRWLSLLGTLVDDRYELRGVLGRGASGVVFRAHDRRLRRDVAMKVLTERESAARAIEEASLLAQLDHPAIIRVLDTGTWTRNGVDDPYIVTELVEGATLAALLEAGPLDPSVACEELGRMLDGIAHAHSLGIVHGDIKTSNVFVDERGAWRLGDVGLGVARPAVGGFRGSIPWAAPELLAGAAASEASDQWAAAVVGIEALTGHRPFTGSTPQVTAAAIEAGAPDLSGLPADLVVVFERALAPAPDARWASVAELARRIRSADAPDSTVVTLPRRDGASEDRARTPNEPSPGPPRTRRIDVAIASLVAVIATIGLVAAVAWQATASASS